MTNNNKYDIDNTNVKSNALISSISGISNILRSYTIDNSLKKEIDYKVVYKIKRALSDYGFNICYFNPKKLIINDFLIEIGFRNVSFNEVYSDIEKICGNFIELGVSSVFKESNKGKLYINIVPKINFSIDYGFCNLSSSENNVSGDNYIIKDLAVDENYQSENVASLLVNEMLNHFRANSIYNYHVFTKPIYRHIFESFGFKKIIETEKVVMLEGGANFINNKLLEIKNIINKIANIFGRIKDCKGVNKEDAPKLKDSEKDKYRNK